jgi:hypothetical protein
LLCIFPIPRFERYISLTVKKNAFPEPEYKTCGCEEDGDKFCTFEKDESNNYICDTCDQIGYEKECGIKFPGKENQKARNDCIVRCFTNPEKKDAPWVVPTFLSDYFFAIMFLRIFFLIRTIFNHSIYTDAFFKKLCREYGFNPGVRFTLKCHLDTSPGKTICYLFFGTLFIISYVYRIFESPFLIDWKGDQEDALS